jgi:hypothetical protein
MMRKDSRKHQGSIYFKEGGRSSMKLRKMMLNINGVDRMFMCDPENDIPLPNETKLLSRT